MKRRGSGLGEILDAALSLAALGVVDDQGALERG